MEKILNKCETNIENVIQKTFGNPLISISI